MIRAYLDHAATTPVRAEVADAVRAAFDEVGNAGSVHRPGQAAKARLADARERLAAAVGAHPTEVVFTSGGTESDNLAVIGAYRGSPRRSRIVVSTIEHPAVIEAAGHLERHEGARVTWVDPSPEGIVTAAAVGAALGRRPGEQEPPALASVMWVNNEIGTIAEIPGIVEEARRAGVPVHSDAVQAVGHVPVHFADSGLTSLSLTGHKLGGPVGCGALLVRRDAALTATSYGGGQERGLRSGTVAVPLVIGLALAVELAVRELDDVAARQVALRDAVLQGIRAAVPDAVVTGAWDPGQSTRRSPANAHVLLPGADLDALLFLLDNAGIAVATGSACHAGVTRPSHVVLALGVDPALARGALRISLGRDTCESDVAALLAALPDAVGRARAGSVGGPA